MSQREVAIVGRNNTKAAVTGQEELLVKINSTNPNSPVITTPSEMGADAFGRLRTSTPFTIGDYKNLYAIDPNLLQVTSLGGTITYQQPLAAARLTVPSTANATAILQSKIYHHYLPGKSQLVFTTFNFYAPANRVRKRIGYFDDNDGIYFQQENTSGILSFCVRTSTSGTPSNAATVTQDNWNLDKCDGTGPSGFAIDTTKTQIFFIDFQWLGVGRVRVGFVHNGKFVPAHEFNHSNVLANVYMSTPNLPVRAEIVSTATGAGGFIDVICSSVVSEGGYVESGQDWAAQNTTLRSIASAATLPVFAFRLKNSFGGVLNKVLARLNTYSVISTTQPLTFSIIKLPNAAALTTGTGWVAANANSAVEYNIGATAYTGGEILNAGYVAASTSAKDSLTQVANPTTAKKNFIAQNYTSTDSEIYVIVATNIGSNATDVGVAVQWREIF